MRRLLTVFLIAAAALPQSGPLPPAEAEAGWLRLFDGETLFGWTIEGAAKAQASGGVLTVEPSSGGWLRTNLPFADFELHAEFQFTGDIDSGLYLRAPRGALRSGHQVQIGELTTDGFPTGSLVGVARARKSRDLAGRWHTLDLVVRGSSVTVRLDGKESAEARSFQSAAGFIGIEAPVGGALSVRNLLLKPIGRLPLFNGQDLTGWRGVEPPNPADTPAEWTVRDQMLHVEKGPGQLETETAWDDFILQLDIRVNTIDSARHPNSGVFFRGDQDAWWSGYESQIRNEFTGDNRARPVDFGTGGIYHRQPARTVVSSDNEWFTKIIVASGRHIGVWINGYQVSDFFDESPEGTNVSEGKARLVRGTISLQAHDPATNLDFRNIRIAPLARVSGR